ncbi:helix-turn-helix domain-containing protein [bacterium]|nr:helix-turn-helix domain-containing protein [bacterium]
MSEYLSKEEIKQWRSSLEKITLEEFAARLGKKVEEKKETNDLVDIVLHGKPVVSEDSNWSSSKVERLSSIAERAYEKEKELYVSPFSAQNLKVEDSKSASPKEVKKSAASSKSAKKPSESNKVSKKSEKTFETAKKIISNTKTGDDLRDEVRIVFKKALTDREQKVFDYFAAHRNKIVYAKDLAELLELPRDYVYKYIKNLRAKIDGEALKNADKGGFVLTV